MNKRLFFALFIVTLFLITSCSQDSGLVSTYEVEVAETSGIANTEEVNTSEVVSVSSSAVSKILPIYSIDVEDGYNPMWEYLEYGETVEYCQPDWYENSRARVDLILVDEDHLGGLRNVEFFLNPPQYRSFIELMGSGLELVQNFEFEVTVVDDRVDSIIAFVDAEGNTAWDFSYSNPPREFNDLEREYFTQVTLNPDQHIEGYTVRVDLDPGSCPNSIEGQDVWSPMEYVVRARATRNYLEENDLWISVAYTGGYNYGIEYRWVDSYGNVLKPENQDYTETYPFEDTLKVVEYLSFKLPEDTWVTLQMRELISPWNLSQFADTYNITLEDYVANISNVPWAEYMKLNLEPKSTEAVNFATETNLYFSVLNTGSIWDFYRTGNLAELTNDWSNEDIILNFLLDPAFR